MRTEGKGHFFTYVYFPAFICFVLTRPRYQVSVYRTIGPLVIKDAFYIFKEWLSVFYLYTVLFSLSYTLHQHENIIKSQTVNYTLALQESKKN